MSKTSSVVSAVESDQFLSSWGRFLYDVVSLCEQVAETLLTVVNSWIFSLNSTDGQSEVSVYSTSIKASWNSRLTGFRIINQEFRSFSRCLKVPVKDVINTWTGLTSDGDSLSWNNRLRSRRLSQDDLSWWSWTTWGRGEGGLLRQIRLGERWSTWKQKSIISLTWRTDGRRSMLLVSVFLHHSRTSLCWTWLHSFQKRVSPWTRSPRVPSSRVGDIIIVALKGLDSHWSTLAS